MNKNVLSLVSCVPKVTVPTQASLSALPTTTSRYKAFYKRFYRLRNHLPSDITSWYKCYLRRRFVQNDYEARRQRLLGLNDSLSESDLLDRCRNTLAFVFNATVATQLAATAGRPIFYDDLKTLYKDRPELQVIRTIVEVEARKPAVVLADTEWAWVTEIQHQLAQNDTKWTKNKRKTIKAINIGLLNHDRNIMRLNETLQLCL
ncbi:uncharacterized protein KQ657_004712 [Scheffersomyces spartinae]|uniref:Uncharacterized protein n=1 Tax=Scheffersomyces spartinae TaxID=45513 RepID=A0A9P7VAW7_9ASCO|nr:uncharacterized protein KQ657_004712 [Scheffersomyces spartinae]KAG7194497.1 hypothetical protein KQ657_004712 [Scheffersomyces spartinae]